MAYYYILDSSNTVVGSKDGEIPTSEEIPSGGSYQKGKHPKKIREDLGDERDSLGVSNWKWTGSAFAQRTEGEKSTETTAACTALDATTSQDGHLYFEGVPKYDDPNIVVVPPFCVKDSTNITDISIPTTTNVDMSTIGINGCTVAEASVTWYYLYALRGDSGSGLVLSPDNVAGGDTLTNIPAGYDTYFRQIPLCVRNDENMDLIPFFVSYGWPYRPRIMYDTEFGVAGGSGGPTTILNTSSASGTWQTICCNCLTPPIARLAEFRISFYRASSEVTIHMRDNTNTTDGVQTKFYHTGSSTASLRVVPGQTVQYKANPANPGTKVLIEALAFTVTEVS